MRIKYDKNDIIHRIRKTSAENSFDEALLLAVAKHESDFDPLAKRFEEHVYDGIKHRKGWLKSFYTQALKYARERNVSLDTEIADESFSYGLFQIMGFNLRFMNYNYPDLSSILYDIEEQCLYAIAFLQELVKTYPDKRDVLSIYNSGLAYGRSEAGKVYADHVFKLYNKYKSMRWDG